MTILEQVKKIFSVICNLILRKIHV